MQYFEGIWILNFGCRKIACEPLGSDVINSVKNCALFSLALGVDQVVIVTTLLAVKSFYWPEEDFKNHILSLGVDGLCVFWRAHLLVVLWLQNSFYIIRVRYSLKGEVWRNFKEKDWIRSGENLPLGKPLSLGFSNFSESSELFDLGAVWSLTAIVLVCEVSQVSAFSWGVTNSWIFWPLQVSKCLSSNRVCS